jgi:hypothetical protein
MSMDIFATTIFIMSVFIHVRNYKVEKLLE